MKKRLLSAVLALAMVLTLLPVSVFAAAPTGIGDAVGNGTETATYYDKNNASLGANGVSGAPGWFVQLTDTDTNKTYYFKIGEGIIYNGKYWKSQSGIPNTVTSGITIIGAVNYEIGPSVTSLSLDIYGGISASKATLSFPSGSNPLLTSLTVNDSKYASEGRSPSNRGSVELPSSWPVADKGMTLSLTNVTSTSTIVMSGAVEKGNVSRSITLNNASLDNVTLYGTDDGDMSKTAAQTISLSNGSTIGAVTVTGSSSSSVKIADSTAGAIGFTAPGGSVQVSGNSQTGKITVDSGERNDPGKAVSVPSVSVTGTNTTGVAGIERATDDTSTSASSFTISGGSKISAGITTANGSVTVTSSTTSTIGVDNGSVTINGPTANTGKITLGSSGKGTVALKVTGTNNTISNIENDTGTLTVDLPADPANNYGTITDKSGAKAYQGHNVKGGTFTGAVPAGWLANEGAGALVYQLEADSKFTYYNASQLGTALTAQNLDEDNKLTYVGTKDSNQTITFKNGDLIWGELVSDGYTPIVLPTAVAGVTVNSWFDGTTTYPAGSSYTTAPGTTATVTLNAQELSANVSKLLNASASSDTVNESVYVSLVGNVITVSGGVDTDNQVGGGIPISIDLYTDINPNTAEDTVVVVYNPSSKALTFAAGQTLTKGMTLEASGTAGLDTLRLSNGTKYTLNGSGIKVLAGDLDIVSDSTEVVVTARVSGYSNDQNTALAKQLAGSGTDLAEFDWSGSSLMAQAVNAAAATITPNQINSWITQARRAAWQAKNTGTLPTDTALGAIDGIDDFTTVKLIPYLAVNVTAYNANGTMTATLTPSYRVVVGSNPSDTIYKDVFKGKTTGDADGNYIVQTGRSLGALVGELGQVDVTLQFPSGSALLTAYMHQDNTYVYQGTGGKFEITHGSTSGLGTVVLNTTEPMVTLTDKDGDEKGTYDTLQAAVDDAEDTDEIKVALGYGGSTVINVTGVARTFTVTTEGNHNITASNASGVIVERSKDGKTFTVQLTQDNIAKGNITVRNADGGTASVSKNPANYGDTVTITLSASTGYVPSGVSVTTAGGQSVSVSGSGSTYTFTMPSGSVTVTPSFTRTQTNAYVAVGAASRGVGTAATSAGSSQVAPGTSVTVTTTPGVGQRTMGLSVTGTTAYRTGANTFTFSVPSGYSTVTVTPQFDVNNGTLFSDVWSTDYYSQPVAWAVSRGITNGTGTYTFGSGNGCTREDMVTFLWRNAGSPVASNTYNPFWDVQPGSYYYNAVLWAVSKGITNGVSANQFGVGQYVTRAQAVTFLYRASGSPAASVSNGFYDVPSNEYYAKAVSWAVGKGITNGDGSTVRFNPNGSCLRAQIVTFMYRNAVA